MSFPVQPGNANQGVVYSPRSHNSSSKLLEKGSCHAECHMGLRPTNSNEHHGGAPSLILKDFARDVRRSVAKPAAAGCFLLKTNKSRSLSRMRDRDDIVGRFSSAC